MQENGRLLSAILNEVKCQAKPGVTTFELETLARNAIQREGAEPAFLNYKGYPAVICASVNHEVVHGIPSKDKILAEGDLLKLDIGLKRYGLFSDMAETIFIGNPPDSITEKLVSTTKKALMVGIQNAHAGETLGKISHSVQKVIESEGFAVIQRYVGHGIGRELHEKPPVPNFGPEDRGPRLKEGMVIAIEPIATIGAPKVKILKDGWTSVTIDGKINAHFEHCIAITGKGPIILTSTCKAG